MCVDLLLKNDFFYDDGDLTTEEMAALVSRITDKNCGVSEAQVPLNVLKLIPVHMYKGCYYHMYRGLHQTLKGRYVGLEFVPRTQLDVDDIIYTQADLFDALQLPMTQEINLYIE